MLDVLAYRAFHRFAHAGDDAAWRGATLSDLARRYPEPYAGPVLNTATASNDRVEAFLRELSPDLVLARYKSMLPERIFSIPSHGTWVMHPGICPEYRNAHGGFWALVQRDLGRVGVSLLRIDAGVDTGPVYGYFSAAFDEVSESHVVIQERSLFANLGQVADTLQSAIAGTIQPVPTAGRVSRAWGQPWLTAYVHWKWNARRRVNAP
jgi:methionyl-tRNA formyltransferase